MCLLLCFALFLACSQNNSKWIVNESEEGILVLQGVDSVFFYQHAPKSLNGEYERTNYIHPLYGLNGDVLTEDFPEDHYHHRGIFWAWHQIFAGDERLGDGWTLENFETEVVKSLAREEGGSLVVSAVVDWKSPLRLDDNGNKKSFAREDVTIEVFPKSENYRIIDFDIEIQPLIDSLMLGGSEDEKGYGGFSWRMVLPGDVRFDAVSGQVQPQTLSLEAGKWMKVSGNIAGDGVNQGLVVISHPENPGNPQPWILRAKRSMQNAAYPGRYPVHVDQSNPLRLKYRMVVFEGPLSKETIGGLENTIK